MTTARANRFIHNDDLSSTVAASQAIDQVVDGAPPVPTNRSMPAVDRQMRRETSGLTRRRRRHAALRARGWQRLAGRARAAARLTGRSARLVLRGELADGALRVRFGRWLAAGHRGVAKLTEGLRALECECAEE